MENIIQEWFLYHDIQKIKLSRCRSEISHFCVFRAAKTHHSFFSGALSGQYGYSFVSQASEGSASLRRFTFTRIGDDYLPAWPSIEDFTIKLGAKKINDYLSSFNMQEEWTYAVLFLRKIVEKLSTLYHYQVRSDYLILFPI